MSVSNYRLGKLSADVVDDIQATTGLHLPKKPTGVIPTLPVDVTELADEDLMVLFTDFIAWADYAATQTAVSTVEEKEQQRILDIKKARAVASGDSSGTVTVAKAKAEEDAETETADAVERFAYRKILESIYHNLERDASLLSRELSRRLGDQQSRKDKFKT